MKTITPADLSFLTANRSDVPLLDVRTPVEFTEVHVPNAINEPLHSLRPLELVASGKIPRDQPVYLFCRTGARAAKAATAFANEGFAHTVVVEGGTLGWIETGLPVNRSVVKVISLERQVRIVAGSLVFAGVVLGSTVSPAFLGLATFVGAGLVFAGITDFCGMGQLLARLPWNARRVPG